MKQYASSYPLLSLNKEVNLNSDGKFGFITSKIITIAIS